SISRSCVPSSMATASSPRTPPTCTSATRCGRSARRLRPRTHPNTEPTSSDRSTMNASVTSHEPATKHEVRAHKSAENLPREEQPAWKIAQVAVDPVEVEAEVVEMIANRIIDNASVAIASLNRKPVVSAREQAQRHPYQPGAAVFGVEGTVSPEWAAWANGVAVRELDYHDTFLAAEYSHPGDNIPPILAVAQ